MKPINPVLYRRTSSIFLCSSNSKSKKAQSDAQTDPKSNLLPTKPPIISNLVENAYGILFVLLSQAIQGDSRITFDSPDGWYECWVWQALAGDSNISQRMYHHTGFTAHYWTIYSTMQLSAVVTKIEYDFGTVGAHHQKLFSAGSKPDRVLS